MTTLAEAETQIRAALGVDLPKNGLQVDGRIHRFGPKRRCWYVLREYTTRKGARVVVGNFGDWKAGNQALQIERTRFTDEEWREFERKRLADAQRQEQRRKQRADYAANRARQQWLAAVLGGESPYLERKGVTAEGVKFFADGTVLVPAYRFDVANTRGKPTMVGVQKIAPDGTKRFNKGMQKEGSAHRIGNSPVDGEPMLLAEGLATALTLREAVQKAYPVFVGFDAGNLMHVAKILRARYPKSPLLVCADDDWQTRDPAGTPMNPGVQAAEKIVLEVSQSDFVAPIFGGDREPKDTDFNDLQAREGIDVVRGQLQAAIGRLKPAEKPRRSEPRNKIPGWLLDRVDEMRERYSLIYGTDTVWDEEERIILKVGALRLHWGEAAQLWLGDQNGRRTISRERVVFDPTRTVDADTHINLFEGFPVKPTPDRHPARWVELLQFLCRERGQDQTPITDWVTGWLAYPLQNPGAKMKTAIVMHGREGAGKNVVFDAVRKLYGKHGGIIGQAELESQFTEWLSAKCFLVANEVLSRTELRQHIGKLKGLVTEGEVMINEKNLPRRAERNHANLTFLSNELQPIWIDPKDRRYLVVRTPDAREEEFYREVARELEGDGLGGLFYYLLNVPLGDFNEHTKPLMTEAKEQLADLGRSSAQLFFEAWRAGELDIPFGHAALLDDLFKAYKIFCARIGERNPAKVNRFSAELVECGSTRRERQRVPLNLNESAIKERQQSVIETSSEPGYRWQLVDLLAARKGLWQMQSDGARSSGDPEMT